MTDRLIIALAQLNPIMGDIAGNLARARKARAEAAAADIILFPELFITAYPPEDLVLKPALQDDAMAAIHSLASDTGDGGPAICIGTPWRDGSQLFNACAVLDQGRILGLSYKRDLPNYGVFDEKRVFAIGPLPKPILVRGVPIGLPICEDIWSREPTDALVAAGAELLLVPNGSPYERGKTHIRQHHISARIRETGLPLIYLNQIGGQDEIVFDGASCVMNADGTIALHQPAWREDISLSHWHRTEQGWTCKTENPAKPEPAPDNNEWRDIYHAMMLGLKDYVNKNRFPGVVLGMSGGIDSALSAAVAVDALGADRVRCVMMPSRYTSQESLEDAAQCAQALHAPYETISIEQSIAALNQTLAPIFAGKAPDTTEENIQSRIRGLLLMALSNKFGPMVLTTGNKSEMSVGYATLYGDMCGGYNVLKDVYKTQVFKLAHWRNQNHPTGGLGPHDMVIPSRIISKPPSAELRPDQKDEDSLPPYDILDGILECLVELEMKFEDVCARGYHPATVKRIEQLLYISEYKRRQAPPGVKISARNFGRDRRYPITNAFRDARDF